MTQIQELQKRIGETNGKNGFNEYEKLPPEHQNNYIGNKLMLVGSELAEAQDELRTGHPIDETYYTTPPVPTSLAVEFPSGGDAQEYWNEYQAAIPGPKKPEGFPSEIADAVIRLFGVAYETGIDLEAAIREKMAYNDTRPFKHGKKF